MAYAKENSGVPKPTGADSGNKCKFLTKCRILASEKSNPSKGDTSIYLLTHEDISSPTIMESNDERLNDNDIPDLVQDTTTTTAAAVARLLLRRIALYC